MTPLTTRPVFMLRAALLGLLFPLLSACEQPDNTQSMPPGFTDAPPPSPTSNTMVLSGGTLLVDPPVADAVLVITDGKVQAWGQRGQIEMPNDSIGHDMRGKWLQPAADPMPGQTAAFRIYAENPDTNPNAPQQGRVQGSELEMTESD